MASLLLGAAIGLYGSGTARAATFDWNPVFASGSFGTNLNWSPNGIPVAGDTARFNLGDASTATFNFSPTNAILSHLSGDTIFRPSGTNATYTLTSDSSITGGTLTVDPDGIFRLNLNFTSLTLSGGSTFTVNAGAVSNSAALNVGSSSAGSMVFNGSTASYTNTSSAQSTLGFGSGNGSLTFNSQATGSFAGALRIGGGPSIGGSLEVLGGSTLSFTNANIGNGSTVGQTGTVLVDGSGSTITQTGSSTLNLGKAADSTATITVSGGGIYNTGTGVTNVNATGAINIGAPSPSGTFNANGDVNVNGGSITRTSGGFNLASGRTLTASNNGQINLGGNIALSGGTTWNVQSGADLFNSGFMDIGVSGGVTAVNIDGTGSSLTTGSSSSFWGASGHTAQVTIRNGASASVGGIELARASTAGTTGTLSVESGATMTTGNLLVAHLGGATTTGTVTVTGTGSTLTQTGSSALTLGHASSGSATLNVLSGGTFTTGTGTTNVNATGSISISGLGSNFNANGDVNVNGGSITRSLTNIGFNLAAGRTLTASNNAQINLGGSIQLSAGTTWNILSGADLFNVGSMDIGNIAGTTSVTIDGAGSSLTTGSSASLWGNGGHAQVTIRNGASASVGGIELARHSTGTLSVESGATMTTDILNVTTNGVATTGTVTVTGSGSTLTQNGSNALTLGHFSSGSATLNVLDGGTFTTGTGTTTVNATGSIDISGTGSAFNANGNVNVNGGSITRTSGSFKLASGRTLTASNGAQMDLGGSTALSDGTTWSIQSGAALSSSGGLNIGVFSGSTALTIDGSGSSLSTGSDSFWGFSSHTAQVIIRNSASASVGGILLASSSTAGTTGTISVESGATMTTGNLSVAANGGATTTGIITVQGPGSTLTQAGSSMLTLGISSSGSAALNVLDGGTFTAGTGGTTLNATGSITIDGGFANLGQLNLQGGSLNFLTGSLSYGGDLTVGSGGLLGTNLSVTATRNLGLTGTTTVNAFRKLTLDGGQFSTGELVIQPGGIFDFIKGTLAITGTGGFEIGSAGELGSTLVLGTQQTVQVAHHTQIAGDGFVSIGNGGRLVSGTLANHGEIALAGSNARIVTSSATLTNHGLLSGDGRIEGGFVNAATGIVNVDAGKKLTFNSGIANQAGGRITGRGTLVAPSIDNHGQMLYSGGFSDVFAKVTNHTGSQVIISGASTSTFYEEFEVKGGAELRVSDFSNAVFFDDVYLRNGSITGGGGNVFLEAGLFIGDSPGVQDYGFNTTLSSSSTMRVQIAGTDPSVPEYDQHNFLQNLTLQGGTLRLELIGLNELDLPYQPQFGDSFTPITVQGTWSGTFGTYDLPALSGGLQWDFGSFYNTGTFSVIPEPSTGLLALPGLALLMRRRRTLNMA